MVQFPHPGPQTTDSTFRFVHTYCRNHSHICWALLTTHRHKVKSTQKDFLKLWNWKSSACVGVQGRKLEEEVHGGGRDEADKASGQTHWSAANAFPPSRSLCSSASAFQLDAIYFCLVSQRRLPDDSKYCKPGTHDQLMYSQHHSTFSGVHQQICYDAGKQTGWWEEKNLFRKKEEVIHENSIWLWASLQVFILPQVKLKTNRMFPRAGCS